MRPDSDPLAMLYTESGDCPLLTFTYNYWTTPLMTAGVILILMLAAVLLHTLAHYYKSFDKKVERALQQFSILGFSQLAVNLIILFLGFQASLDHLTYQANIWLLFSCGVSVLAIVYAVFAQHHLFSVFEAQPRHRRPREKNNQP